MCKVVLTLVKAGPQTLPNGHGAFREDAGIRNPKSAGLSSAVQPSPPTQILQPHCFCTELLTSSLALTVQFVNEVGEKRW